MNQMHGMYRQMQSVSHMHVHTCMYVHVSYNAWLKLEDETLSYRSLLSGVCISSRIDGLEGRRVGGEGGIGLA